VASVPLDNSRLQKERIIPKALARRGQTTVVVVSETLTTDTHSNFRGECLQKKQYTPKDMTRRSQTEMVSEAQLW
jgi:hypothetical protein